MEKRHSILINHLHDLAEQHHATGKTICSDFLAYDEVVVFRAHKREYQYVDYHFSGRDDLSERRMICFGERTPFPITILHVTHKDDAVLTHRDYLGALMNLGIERSLIGNIYVLPEGAYIEVVDRIHELIIHELTRVKNTDVSITKTDLPEGILLQTERKEISVASERLDTVIAAVFNLSRRKAQDLIEAEKVILPLRTASSTLNLKTGDVVSVRGHGKFRYEGVVRETRKERYIVEVHLYRAAAR